jgi:2-C-methyl-D-erythritol 4-phosphate cytidylyltransferase/2-C-methyl-D-erythritol 2,4-cyclodiphosphate synthase
MNICAIVVAAGKGARLRSRVSKPLVRLGSKEIILYSLEALSSCPDIKGIIIVVNPSNRRQIEKCAASSGLEKIIGVVNGGKRRQDSVRNGLKGLPKQCDHVLIHDAGRPFIDAKSLKLLIAQMRKTGAAILGVPAGSTIKEAKPSTSKNTAVVQRTLPRDLLWEIQTPQAFRKDIIVRAYEKFGKSDVTDDSSIVEKLGIPVSVVMGSYRNMKITTREDISKARALLDNGASRTDKAGIGYDIHRLKKGRRLVLGGVLIPFDKGLEGHSDADCLIHAVCDALLGAAGLGDIGMHFPNTDPAYKGIASSVLLGRAAVMLKKNGFSVSNIDSVIVAQEPHLQMFKGAMAANISAALNIPVSCVCVKATTPERLGSLGASKGIACWASALITKGA